MLRHLSYIGLLSLLITGCLVPHAVASTATDITGLYYTGVDNNGNLLSAGSSDPHWSVTYASTTGGATKNTTYMGNAYVVNPTGTAGAGLAGGWANNTSSAQWITAPNATTSSNGGGIYNLPGNGTTTTKGIYIYRLAFTITGAPGDAAGTTINNNVAISLTLAADDQFKIWVNPGGSGTTVPSATPAFTGLSSWVNTTTAVLANFTDSSLGAVNNSTFKVGTNYIVVQVDNTNSIIGNAGSNPSNPSGLLFYQTASNWAVIDGVVIPEMGAWIPALGGVCLYLVVFFKRRRDARKMPS